MADEPKVKSAFIFDDKGALKSIDFELLRAQGKSYVIMATKPCEVAWHISEHDQHNLLGFMSTMTKAMHNTAVNDFVKGIPPPKTEAPKDNITPSYVG